MNRASVWQEERWVGAQTMVAAWSCWSSSHKRREICRGQHRHAGCRDLGFLGPIGGAAALMHHSPNPYENLQGDVFGGGVGGWGGGVGEWGVYFTSELVDLDTTEEKEKIISDIGRLIGWAQAG